MIMLNQSFLRIETQHRLIQILTIIYNYKIDGLDNQLHLNIQLYVSNKVYLNILFYLSSRVLNKMHLNKKLHLWKKAHLNWKKSFDH
jgi:hypothetical protein